MFISVLTMRVFLVFCCVVLLAVVHPNQSYNPFDQFGVYCKLEAYSQLISRKGCDSQYIRVKACLGTCASYAHPLDHPPYFKKVCECCKPSYKRWKVFKLKNCDSAVSPLVEVESAVKCNCSRCSWKEISTTCNLTLVKSSWNSIRRNIMHWHNLFYNRALNNLNIILVSRNLYVTRVWHGVR